jgi:hypothetical protein
MITVKLCTSKKLYKDKIREFRKVWRYNAIDVNNAMEIICDDFNIVIKGIIVYKIILNKLCHDNSFLS